MIFNHNYVKSDNKYDDLCNENKQTDNMIGLLMLITYLDKFMLFTFVDSSSLNLI